MMTKKVRERIEHWITSQLEDSVDDLHIDEIESSFSKRDKWIIGAEYCLNTATDIRDEMKLPFKVLLAFSLRSGENLKGINFKNLTQFENELDYTPPSLYAFSKDKNWSDFGIEPIKINFLEFNLKNIECNYLEYKEQDDEEFRRSLWLELVN